MCQKTKEYKLTNEQESKTIWPHRLLIKNRMHLVSFKRFEFVEEKTCLLLTIKENTKHLCTYSFCNFKNMLRTFLGFRVGKF